MHPFLQYFAEKISCIFFHLDNSVVDPHHVDADPTFNSDVDPDPNPEPTF